MNKIEKREMDALLPAISAKRIQSEAHVADYKNFMPNVSKNKRKNDE